MVVVVEGNVLHHVKREGNCSGGGNVWGGGICPSGNIQGEMSGSCTLRVLSVFDATVRDNELLIMVMEMLIEPS